MRDYCRLASDRFIEFREPVEEYVVTSMEDFAGLDAFISKYSVTKSKMPKIMVAISYDLCRVIESTLVKACPKLLTNSKSPLIVLRAYAKRRIISRSQLLRELNIRCANLNTKNLLQPSKIKHVSKKKYLIKLQKIAKAIKSGDVYQVNFSQRFTARKKVNPERLFRALVDKINPRCAAMFHLHDRVVVSASPELFLARTRDSLVSEPIKGTRSLQIQSYTAAKKQLLASMKERSELAMVTDVIRNDMGKIAEIGSVKVKKFPAVMRLPYLIHAYAQITSKVRKKITFAKILAALFPSASITGAPKLAAMESIYRLEGSLRGFYCGSLGTINSHEHFTLSVAIRTFELTATTATLSAGGGIVHDSIPSAEFAESLLKATPLLALLDIH